MKLDKPLNLTFGEEQERYTCEGCDTDAPTGLERSLEGLSEGLSKGLVDCYEQIKRNHNVIEGEKGLRKELLRIEKRFLWELDKSAKNLCKQIEASIAVQSYLNFGTLPVSFHGWPVSPDFALFLIQQIEQSDYDLIIEFGSGTSTAILASVCATKKKRTGKVIKVLSFDHHEMYFEKTKSLLKFFDPDGEVELVHAPLVPTIVDGKEYLYYSCIDALNDENSRLQGGQVRALVIIDGPPGVTGPLARFPALPMLLENLDLRALDIVLDDSGRDEEKEIAMLWDKILSEESEAVERQDLPFEKGAAFWSVRF